MSEFLHPQIVSSPGLFSSSGSGANFLPVRRSRLKLTQFCPFPSFLHPTYHPVWEWAHGSQKTALGTVLRSCPPYQKWFRIPHHPSTLGLLATEPRDLSASTSPELGLQECATIPGVFHTASMDPTQVLKHAMVVLSWLNYLPSLELTNQ